MLFTNNGAVVGRNLLRLKVKGNFEAETEKNGKEAPIWGVAQFGEMSHPGS